MSLADDILFSTFPQVQQTVLRGVEIDEIDVYGFTPLIETVIIKNMMMAKLLLEHGAGINYADVAGRTPLFWAVDSGQIEFCKLFLEHGADPNTYTIASEPILVNPLLRQQNDIKQLLYRHGADLNFALDFINAKLIGHRFELAGQVDIVNAKGDFIELDYEGFFLEFTLGIIRDSIRRFIYHYSARHLKDHFKRLQIIMQSLQVAAELISYEHYAIDLKQYDDRISELLNSNILILPIASEGHAICFIRFGDLLAKCDRGEESHRAGSVVIYKMNQPQNLTKQLLKDLIYKHQSNQFLHEGINPILGLQPLTQLPIPSQTIGNCSWANVEATVPTLHFLLSLKEKNSNDEVIQYKQDTFDLYHDWQIWDRERALDECRQSFYRSSPASKASKAAILGAVLFQSLDCNDPRDVELARKLFKVLTIADYEYVLRSYVSVYSPHKEIPETQNLLKLMELCNVVLY